MSQLYGFAARFSGCMAGLCAVLALLATPSSSQADDASNCLACCTDRGPLGYAECYDQCMQGSGPCAIAVDCKECACDRAPTCADDFCANKDGCKTGCNCKDVPNTSFCNCPKK